MDKKNQLLTFQQFLKEAEKEIKEKTLGGEHKC